MEIFDEEVKAGGHQDTDADGSCIGQITYTYLTRTQLHSDRCRVGFQEYTLLRAGIPGGMSIQPFMVISVRLLSGWLSAIS